MSIELTSPEAVSSNLRAINYYEWDERLQEYFIACDSLVPGESMVTRLHDVIDREEEILLDLLRDKNTYVAEIPRKRDWHESGTDREIVEAVQSLGARYDRETTHNDLHIGH